MNKKILISLSIIGIVAAMAIGATSAYFSDTETSTGNTFTAGAIDLKVDNHCYYNGMECREVENGIYHWFDEEGDTGEVCTCTWDPDDLDGHLFFDFADLKPGDWGEDTISLHINNNPAWACAAVRITEDQDVDCTEPEIEAEGDDCAPENDGELDENLEFVFWADDGNNIYEPGCEGGGEHIILQGKLSDIGEGQVFTLADSNENNLGGENGEPLDGEHTYHIGKLWCFGNIDVDCSGHITCDGEEVGNAPQTDEVKGDVMFYAVQSRNNDDFQCESWTPNW